MARPPTLRDPELARVCAEALVRERHRQGLSQKDLAALIGCSRPTISRYELGRHVLPPEMAERLDRALNTDRLTSLLPGQAAERRQQERLERYVVIEQDEATAIRQWQSQVIPALVQTKSYARAVLAATIPPRGADEIEALARARLERQHVLETDRDLSVHLIIDEGAVRRGNDPDVVRQQWEHLMQVSDHPRMTLQVLPSAEGPHACLQGSYTLVGTPHQDVLYLDTEIIGRVVTERVHTMAARARWDSLIARALSPTATQGFLNDLISTEGATA